ncbi:MAG TPA: NAD(P)-dependent oxidoreductase [Acidobacteriota bacterium]|jgi:3-hydroxyisobutyrate dehydrogenase
MNQFEKKIGFAGMGVMGRPMAQNLIDAGFSVTVYNRTREKTASFPKDRIADTPSDLAQRSQVLITMLGGTEDVRSFLLGQNGVVKSLSAGTTVIDMSTISPEATEKMAREIEGLSCGFLDAPVTGGQKGAIARTLTIMVGGKKELFDSCMPIFSALGKNVIHFGPAGSGQKCKAVNQLLCGQHIVALSEAICLARKSGLDVEKTLAAVGGGAAASWMIANLGPLILKQDYAPGFAMRWQHKDLRIAVEQAERVGLDLPGLRNALALFTEALQQNLGENGTQALVKIKRYSQ